MNDQINKEAISSKRTLNHTSEEQERVRIFKKKRSAVATLQAADINSQSDLAHNMSPLTLTRPQREAAKEGMERRRRSFSNYRSRSQSRGGSRSDSEEQQQQQQRKKGCSDWQEISMNDPRTKNFPGLTWHPADLNFFYNIQTRRTTFFGKRGVPFQSRLHELPSLPRPFRPYLLNMPTIKVSSIEEPMPLPHEGVLSDDSDSEYDDTEELCQAVKNIFTGETMDAADYIIEYEPHLLVPMPDNFLSMPLSRPKEDMDAVQANVIFSGAIIDLTDDGDDFEITKVIPPAPDSIMGREFERREQLQGLLEDKARLGFTDEELNEIIMRVKKEGDEQKIPEEEESRPKTLEEEASRHEMPEEESRPETPQEEKEGTIAMQDDEEVVAAVEAPNQPSEQQDGIASRSSGTTLEDSIVLNSDDGDEEEARENSFPMRTLRARSSSILVNHFRDEAEAEETERRAQSQLEAARLAEMLRQQRKLIEQERLMYPAPIAPDISMAAEELESLQLTEESASERDNTVDESVQAPSPSTPAIPPSTPPPQQSLQSHSHPVNDQTALTSTPSMSVRRFRGLPQRKASDKVK